MPLSIGSAQPVINPYQWDAIVCSATAVNLRPLPFVLDAEQGREVPMHGKPQVADLEALLTERGEWLLRTAILLTGSHEAGEDLLQGALERLCRNWAAIHGDPEGYLRRTMTHLATDRWRRNARWLIRQRQLRAAQAGPSRHQDQRHTELRQPA